MMKKSEKPRPIKDPKYSFGSVKAAQTNAERNGFARPMPKLPTSLEELQKVLKLDD